MQSKLLSIGRFYINSYMGLPSKTWLGISMNFLESALMGVFYFLSIYFVNDLKFSAAEAGAIISFYGIGAIAGGYLGGRLSDSWSPIGVSITSLLLQAFAFFMFIKLKSFQFLVLNVLLMGYAGYAFITSNHLYVLASCHQHEVKRIKAINLLSTASNLGLGISGLVIGEAAAIGFHRIFFITGILILTLAAYMYLVLRTRTHESQQADAHSEVDTAKADIIVSKRNVGLPVLLMSIFFVGAIVSQSGTTYPLYLKELFPQMGLRSVSILFALNSFLIVAVATPLGDFIAKYQKYRVLGLGGFMIGGGLVLLTFSKSIYAAAIACSIYTIGEIMFFCMAQFLCYQSGGKKKKGHGLGMFRVAYGSSRVVGPAAGGYIYHHLSGNMVWNISAFIGFLCLLACSLVSNHD